MTAIQLTLMTVDEARATVDQIKSSLENVRALLFELREREGWRALGYVTWQACIQSEFHLSEQRAHQLLNAHLVDRILAPSWEGPPEFFGKNATQERGSTIVEPRNPIAKIPESHAREFEPIVADDEAVREVYAEVQQRTNGKPTAAAIREVVDERLGLEPRQTTVLRAMDAAEHILQEPPSEKAFYALSRAKLWVSVPPEDVAEVAANPSQDAAGYEELAAWVSEVAAGIRARASGLRSVR